MSVDFDLDVIHEPPEEKKLYGVYRGRVISPLDPFTLGRVQVQIPGIDSIDLFALARIAVPMAGLGHGAYFVPNVGDEVLVAFENGDHTAPVIIGSLWNATAFPPLPSPLPQIRALRTLTGNQVVFSELDGSVTIQSAPTPPAVIPAPPIPTAPYQSVRLGPDGVTVASATTIKLMCGTTTLIVSPAGVTINAGGSTLAITPDGIVMTGNSMSLFGLSEVVVFGGQVMIN